MCFSVLALYCKQSKMGVKSSREKWLKKVKCAAGLDKIWVRGVSNAFCERALSQNSFSGHLALLPSLNVGHGGSSHCFLREKPVLCAVARVHLDDLARSTCGETRRPSAARDGDQWAAFFCSCPTGPPRSCAWPDSCVCSWWVTCLLGFSCLKLEQQAGLALGNGFVLCTGYDNWPWGVVGRRWGRPWIPYS